MEHRDRRRTSGPSDPVPPWLRHLAQVAWCPTETRGRVDDIDRAAVTRALATVTEHEAVSIGRRLGTRPTQGTPVCRLVTSVQDDRYSVAHDHLEIDCHGVDITHVDALNHFGVDGRWFRGLGPKAEDGMSVEDLGARPIVTRAVFLDVPEVRGSEWISTYEPVGSRDLDAALANARTEIRPGDALLLYMGRDRFEAAGHRYRSIADAPDGRPGVSEDGAGWIAESGAAVVAWDFVDAHLPDRATMPVHLLTWAVGLILVDNCSFARLRPLITGKLERTGMLTVNPLELEDATGCAVNPVVVL